MSVPSFSQPSIQKPPNIHSPYKPQPTQYIEQHMIQMETLLMDKKGAASTEKAKKKKMKRSSCSRKEEAAMKVVYISNPIKFQICASEFRSLVQQLTGQYADDPSLHYHYSPPPTTTTTASSNSSTDTVANNNNNNNNNCVGGEEFHPTVEVVQQQSTNGSSCVVQEESNYDYFVPEMLENSTLFYSWHLDMIH